MSFNPLAVGSDFVAIILTALYVGWTRCEVDYMWGGLYVDYVRWTICEEDYMWTIYDVDYM